METLSPFLPPSSVRTRSDDEGLPIALQDDCERVLSRLSRIIEDKLMVNPTVGLGHKGSAGPPTAHVIECSEATIRPPPLERPAVGKMASDDAETMISDRFVPRTCPALYDDLQ